MRRIIRYMLVLTLALSFIYACDSKKTTGPVTEDQASVTIIVQDEFGRPVVGGNVTSNPPTETIVSDDEGKVSFTGIPVREYTFYLRRTNFPVYTKTVTIVSGVNDEVIFGITTEQPDASIISPSMNDFVSIFDIQFSASGIDPEDGALPDSLMVWFSNVDGEIGSGSILKLESLSIGEHTLTLEVSDFDGKKDVDEIEITVVDYNPESYFPMPVGATWNYTHQTNKFSVINISGAFENWTLNEIDVTIEEENLRSSTMKYEVLIGARQQSISYTVKDQFDFDGEKVYVSKTSEEVNIWNGADVGNADEKLTIVTLYKPQFLLIENALDPEAMTENNQEVRVTVIWSYNDPFYGPRDFSEGFTVDTNVSTGEKSIIRVRSKNYEAVPVTIEQNGTLRKWWIAKGIGIVRLEYNSFSENFPPVADLVTSNLSNIAARAAESQKASRAIIPPANNVLNIEPIPSDIGPERLRSILSVLRKASI